MVVRKLIGSLICYHLYYSAVASNLLRLAISRAIIRVPTRDSSVIFNYYSLCLPSDKQQKQHRILLQHVFTSTQYTTRLGC